MASIEEVKGWISNGTYPHVARTSDPLIVRVSRFSLLVNDTNFYAKIKNGLGYKGYLIYSSGLGTPILEESATNETEFFSNDSFKKAISDQGTITGDKFYESAERVLGVLQDAAQNWLDTLELEIVKQPNDNAIKKAIDRLCWQLHYDITESHTNFPEVFKDNDFGDVEIDRYPMETEYWDGTTLKTAISDIAGLEFNGGQPRSYEITHNGYLYESAERIKNFDNHLTLGSYSDRQGAIATFDDHLMLGLYNDNKGAITLFDEHLLKNSYDVDGNGAFRKFDDHLTLGSYNESQGAIKTFDDHLLKGYYDTSSDNDSFNVTNGAFKKFNDALNDENSGSLIKIGTKLVPDDTNDRKYYSISECLRDAKDNDIEQAYSIAKSLRDKSESDTSVSTQVRLQSIVIESGLGSDGSINQSLGTISNKVSTEGESGTVIGKLISLDDKLGQGPAGTTNNTVLYKLSELYQNTYNTKLNTDTVVDRIGSFSQDSIMGNLHDMNSTLTGLKADYNDSGNIIHTIRTWPVT